MKLTKIFPVLLLSVASAQASPFVVEDFESIPVGTKWTMWERWNNPVSSTATVEVDPTNANNHILHVRLQNWNCFPEFVLPAEYAGTQLRSRFKQVRFRLYRTSSDNNDYKQMHLYYGNDQMYQDNSYPYQGDRSTWQVRNYDIANLSEGSTATQLRLGIHCDVSDYYLDDIMLVGEFDDYVTYESGELNLCEKNSSSSYKVYTTPTFIPEGQHLNVYTSRYTDFNAPVAGPGTMSIHAGGERTYLGEHANKKYPDWTKFTGDVHIYKYNQVETGAGFYGVIMAHNGKTFSPENIEDCILTGKVNNMLDNNRVTLHKDAAIAFENGTRAAMVGHLDTEAGSRIYGYYKASAGTGSYLIVGGDDTDGTLAGRIAPMESNGTPLNTALLGIIKEGKGTYTIKANDNCISGGIRVVKGRVNVNNNAEAAAASKLSGGTGTPANNAAVAYVLGGGMLGGTGNIAGIVDVYGKLEPGDKETGLLTLKDYVSNAKASLRMHPEGMLRFRLRSSEDHDELWVNNDIELSKVCEDFSQSDESPRIRVALTPDYDIYVGDEFTLLTASKRLNAADWQWRMIFPSKLTWTWEERTQEDGRYALVVKCVSLDDDPANAGNDAEDDQTGDDDDDWNATFGDDGDTHSIRYYAEQKGVRIGVAVPSSNVALGNSTDVMTSIIRDEFNMVVTENELKWDWCEPSQNYFNFAEGDKLLSFAEANGSYMRGHTLAWHSQVASWVSSDGKKNDKNWTKQQLMDILKNHVTKVVTHYKGRIGEWDVVNECLDDDQSIVRNDPSGYKLRAQSVWTIACGEAFIDSAFVWAHRADPDAKLYLNDYGNEMKGNAKSEAFFNLVKRLKNSGVPIHGVGFQCHLDAGLVDVKALENNIARYAALGLECAITELDLGIDANTEAERQQQARDYYRIVEAALRQPHCRSVLIWGVSDNVSWRQSNPLLWNGAMERKPAYYAVRNAVSAAPTAEEDIREVIVGDAQEPVAVSYYSLGGIRLAAPVVGEVTLVREQYADGAVRSYKIFIR